MGAIKKGLKKICQLWDFKIHFWGEIHMDVIKINFKKPL
jgi:hypothetical protein